MRRKDGTVIDCLLSASVRRDAHGSILGYQGIIEEITEHKRAGLVRSDDSHTLEPQETRTEDIQVQNAQLEDALRQLQGMQQQLITQEKLASLGALTSGVAHEIRNPLNFVNNFAELSTELIQELREELASQPDHLDTQTLEDIEDILFSLEQNVQKITQHGKRADRIVQGMLQHSRGQSGVREPTDINAILEESINLAYHGLRAHDVSFNATFDTAYDTAIGLVNVVPQVSAACYSISSTMPSMRPMPNTRSRARHFLLPCLCVQPIWETILKFASATTVTAFPRRPRIRFSNLFLPLSPQVPARVWGCRSVMISWSRSIRATSAL